MNDKQNPNPIAVDDIDRIIHEPARLNVMLYLYVVEEADFTYLLHKTGLTRGNLSVHLSKLEQSGYVEIKKEFRNKVPRTLILLTPQGRSAFSQYRDRLLEVLNAVN